MLMNAYLLDFFSSK